MMRPVAVDVHDDSDRALLDRYLRDQDGAAFAALVARYADLVYSAAVRRVGDRHMAQDVTQAVFVVLARRAKAVRRDAPLSAWLLSTVRFAAANAVKIERRRRRHEQSAAAEYARRVGACSANPSDVILWQEIAAQLDDAILRLPADDRHAVLLRFIEDRPLRDVAAALRISEVAARQRVSRAIGKLRRRLGRVGAGVEALGASALGELIVANAVRAAPVGLKSACAVAANIGTVAAVGGGAAAGITIAKGAIRMMTWTKMKLAAAVMAAATVGTVGAIAVSNAPAADAAPAAGVGAAAPPQAGAAQNSDGITLATVPPVVIRTTPQSGAADVDAAATTEIRVTFSKDMQDGSWSWSTLSQNTFPQLAGKPKYDADKRTCILPVKLEPGRVYATWLNSDKFGNFKDADGHKAVPYLLIFETRK
jgi:RNA polymerase sigma factor (sigma-70 family)